MSESKATRSIIDTHRHIFGPKLRQKFVENIGFDDTKPLPQANAGEMFFYPELEVERGREMGKQLAEQVRLLDHTRPLTLAFPGTTTATNAEAVFSLLDIAGYNYNLIPTYAADHQQLPKRIMLTTESYPAKAFPLWQISQDNSFVIGDLTWTAMDYLGESGIGAWSYGTPEQAQMATQIMGAMLNTSVVDKMFLGMANGVDMTAAMAQGAADPAAKTAMAVMFHGYPWQPSRPRH